jgi:hypothetical protein
MSDDNKIQSSPCCEMVESIQWVSVGMSEINGVYEFNLSGIVPISECLGEILYEETCSRSNINQNILPDF